MLDKKKFGKAMHLVGALGAMETLMDLMIASLYLRHIIKMQKWYHVEFYGYIDRDHTLFDELRVRRVPGGFKHEGTAKKAVRKAGRRNRNAKGRKRSAR